MVALYFLIIVIGILAISGLRLIYEYERGLVFTLGKYSHVKEPGLRWIIPIVQNLRKVDIRIRTLDIPRQEVMTKDNIPLSANAVVYFKVENVVDAIIKIEDFYYAVQQYTQAALRDVIGNYELDLVLSERDKISESIKKNVDKETTGWGVDIASIRLQEIELPPELKKAISRQAEAERERRGVVIAAEGELKAAENLRKAAETLSKNPAALHLRTLQTIKDIAHDPSQKIVLFLPSDISDLLKKIK